MNFVSTILAFTAALFGSLITFLLFILTPDSKIKAERKKHEFKEMDWTCGALLECATNPKEISENQGLFKEVQDNIFLYGTKNEMNILSGLRAYLFNNIEKNISNYYALAGFILLLNVIRHETYKKPINNNYIFKTYLSDYNKISNDLNLIYNKLVIEYGLSRKYIIK